MARCWQPVLPDRGGGTGAGRNCAAGEGDQAPGDRLPSSCRPRPTRSGAAVPQVEATLLGALHQHHDQVRSCTDAWTACRDLQPSAAAGHLIFTDTISTILKAAIISCLEAPFTQLPVLAGISSDGPVRICTGQYEHGRSRVRSLVGMSGLYVKIP